VAKHETGRHAPFKDELSAVLGTVMRGAEDDECVGVVSAAFGTKSHVVEVHENRVGTAWNDAPAAVPPHDFAPDGWRDVLSRSRRALHAWRGVHRVCFCVALGVGSRLHLGSMVHLGGIAHVGSMVNVGGIADVGCIAQAGRTLDVGTMATDVGICSGGRRNATQVLCVAAGHLHNFRTDERELTIALLPTAAAFLADVERYLIGCAAGVARATQHMSGHEKDRRIVIHGTAELAAKLRHRFPEGRESLGQDFESQDMRRRGRVTRLTRSIPEAVSRHELFDLAQASPSCDREPLVLVVGHGYAGELADRRPVEDAVSQGLVDFGEPIERFGHAQALGSPASGVSEKPFDVTGEASETELKMSSGFESRA
jgi:hypothetical protein